METLCVPQHWICHFSFHAHFTVGIYQLIVLKSKMHCACPFVLFQNRYSLVRNSTNTNSYRHRHCYYSFHNNCNLIGMFERRYFSKTIYVMMLEFMIYSRVFPKLHKVGKVVNKGLHEEEQNKFSKKKLPPVGIEPGTSWSSCQCSTDLANSIFGCQSESLRSF